ncbi:MAG: DUF6498-containing protein [archaeon]
MKVYANGVSFNPFKKAGNDSTVKPPIGGVLRDPSTIFLIASNLLTIVFTVALNWNLILVMWTYWIQSVIIGVFNFKRILSLNDFSTEGFYIGNKQVEPTKETKVFTACFFAFHYGLFHFGYFVFLMIFTFISVFVYNQGISLLDLLFVLIAGTAFFADHWFSFSHNKDKGREKKNIGAIMLFPYARIIPMHLTIIFGPVLWLAGAGWITIVLFMLLKTIADVAMHVVEHRKFK